MIDLSTLNAEQLEAVKDDENNLLILACAGSGKTKTITTKIAYTIETGRLSNRRLNRFQFLLPLSGFSLCLVLFLLVSH